VTAIVLLSPYRRLFKGGEERTFEKTKGEAPIHITKIGRVREGNFGEIWKSQIPYQRVRRFTAGKREGEKSRWTWETRSIDDRGGG